MPIESFAFRLACYEQFHWTPETVKALTLTEAERLAIYFEESGAYNFRKRREMESQSGAPSTSRTERVEFVFGDDDEEDDDLWQQQNLESE